MEIALFWSDRIAAFRLKFSYIFEVLPSSSSSMEKDMKLESRHWWFMWSRNEKCLETKTIKYSRNVTPWLSIPWIKDTGGTRWCSREEIFCALKNSRASDNHDRYDHSFFFRFNTWADAPNTFGREEENSWGVLESLRTNEEESNKITIPSRRCFALLNSSEYSSRCFTLHYISWEF